MDRTTTRCASRPDDTKEARRAFCLLHNAALSKCASRIFGRLAVSVAVHAVRPFLHAFHGQTHLGVAPPLGHVLVRRAYKLGRQFYSHNKCVSLCVTIKTAILMTTRANPRASVVVPSFFPRRRASHREHYHLFQSYYSSPALLRDFSCSFFVLAVSSPRYTHSFTRAQANELDLVCRDPPTDRSWVYLELGCQLGNGVVRVRFVSHKFKPILLYASTFVNNRRLVSVLIYRQPEPPAWTD